MRLETCKHGATTSAIYTNFMPACPAALAAEPTPGVVNLRLQGGLQGLPGGCVLHQLLEVCKAEVPAVVLRGCGLLQERCSRTGAIKDDHTTSAQ